jgi:hypothetical protein
LLLPFLKVLALRTTGAYWFEDGVNNDPVGFVNVSFFSSS